MNVVAVKANGEATVLSLADVPAVQRIGAQRAAVRAMANSGHAAPRTISTRWSPVFTSPMDADVRAAMLAGADARIAVAPFAR